MPEYIPPKVWKENTVNGGRFSTINKPTSGAQEERVLAVGKHPMQLYSLGTPQRCESNYHAGGTVGLRS